MAIFEMRGELFSPTGASRGPWSPDSQHGGPPAMLLARAVESQPAPVPMLVSRLTVELMRPVPLTPLRVEAGLLRGGRRVQLVEASLWAGETEVARARALRIRQAPLELPPGPPAAAPPPGPEEFPPWQGWAAPDQEAYHTVGVELRFASARKGDGPVTAWVRLRQPLLEGEEPTPLQRVAAAADFGNGVAPVLDPRRYIFVNPDLSIHLHREPAGEWVCIRSRSWVEADGRGLAESALHDRRGRIGRAVQSLLVEPR
jgi:hypothetical protein